MNKDPDREILFYVLSELYQYFGSTRFTVKDFAAQISIRMPDDLKFSLTEINILRDNQLNTRSFGKWIKKKLNRPVEGYKIIQVQSEKVQHAIYQIICTNPNTNAPNPSTPNHSEVEIQEFLDLA